MPYSLHSKSIHHPQQGVPEDIILLVCGRPGGLRDLAQEFVRRLAHLSDAIHAVFSAIVLATS